MPTKRNFICRSLFLACVDALQPQLLQGPLFQQRAKLPSLIHRTSCLTAQCYDQSWCIGKEEMMQKVGIQTFRLSQLRKQQCTRACPEFVIGERSKGRKSQASSERDHPLCRQRHLSNIVLVTDPEPEP